MDLQPFKGLLLAIFFIAVGAGVEFNLIAKTPYLVIFGLLAFLVFKLLAQFLLAKSFGLQRADTSRFTIALTQVNEFGFVLVGVTVGLDLLSAQYAGLLTAVIALSMATSPVLLMLDDRVHKPMMRTND